MDEEQMNMEMFQEFIRLDRRKKDLKADLRLVQDEINKLEPIILNDMDEEGVENIKKDGKVLYIHRRVSGAPLNGDRDSAIKWLEDNGHGHIVEENYNTTRLNSLLAEFDKTPGGIPEDFEEAFTIHEIFTLRVRGNK